MQPPLPDPTTADSKEEKTDALSILSDRTLCASPEPDEPVRTPGIPRVPCGVPLEPAACEAHVEQSMRVKTRSVSAVALTLWTIVSLCLLSRIFVCKKAESSISISYHARVDGVQWDLRRRGHCNVLVDLAATAFPVLCEIFARLHNHHVRHQRHNRLWGAVSVLIECPTAVCESDEDRVLRLFVCLGVPVVTVWTWVWIPVMRRFVAEMAT
ncbi:hypothetical protein B0H10DRAFT_2062634 [Mycena sp. CBHHK59/15]|nr:hypothetical protein B0H10DRAFT_2062634 [Mycena sp. CBHHK59/15]